MSLRFLVIAVVLVAFGTESSAGRKVDWSEYIDHDAPARTAPSTPAESAPVATKATKAKKRSVVKKRVASKRKVKARAKRRK